MKLFTTEQAIEMINEAKKSCEQDVELMICFNIIEIPTDEEIEIKSSNIGILSSQKAFIGGAKWMRDKIQEISNNTIDEKYYYVTSNENTLPLLKKIYGDCANDKTATFQVLKKKIQGGNQ